MNFDKTQLGTMKWFARISALVILVLALPFYFGYENPLPFVDPDYSFWDNFARVLPLLLFIGLALAWKFEKVGGYLISISAILGLFLGMKTGSGFSINLLFALIPGILFLIIGSQKK